MELMHNESAPGGTWQSSYPPNLGFLMNQLGAITPHWVVKINGQHILMHLALVPGTGSVINETDFK